MSHVVPNIVLEPEIWQRHKLETRFEMAKRAYNLVRDEWLKRRRKYYQSDAFQEAQKLDDDEVRREAFWQAQEAVGFVGTDGNEKIPAQDKTELFGKPSGDGWCSDVAYHLPSEILRRVAGMAVSAVRLFHTEDDWGEPSPKADPPPLVACGSTVELREDDGIVRIGGPRGGADALEVSINESYLKQAKIRRSLTDRKSHSKAMICREASTGDPLYKAKITCNGHAPLSEDTIVRDGVVGVDVGPTKVAAVGDEKAWFGPITDRSFVDEHLATLRRLGRRLDRQRRANNPTKFNDDGEFVGSGEPWHVSNRQTRTYAEHDEAFRLLVEERQRQHYELAKRLLEIGNRFIVEDNAYNGWQAGLFGSQVGDFAPSTFVDRLEEKAEAAGGSVRRISTWDTYLSSRCHCGRKSDKDLAERRHTCECGVSANRDLYSAFLARHIDSEGELVADHARKEWSKLEPALKLAASESEVAKPDLETVG